MVVIDAKYSLLYNTTFLLSLFLTHLHLLRVIYMLAASVSTSVVVSRGLMVPPNSLVMRTTCFRLWLGE